MMMHIILLIISLVALGLSIFCVVKREKFNFLYQDNNHIGLQTIDIDQKIDALRQEILGKQYISYGDPIGIHTASLPTECLTANAGPDTQQHYTATHQCGIYGDAQTWYITVPPN